MIVRPQKTAENGEIVVALLEDEATVKRFSKKNGHIYLLPENEAFSPIPGDEAVILGPLALAKDAAQMMKQTPIVNDDPTVRGKAALTELFQSIRNEKTPVIVERIVNDIDGIVKIVRFPGWQNTSTGRKEVSRNLRDIVMRKYRIKDQDVFNKAYSYVEQYY